MFITKRNIYQVNLTDQEQSYLDELRKSKSEISTLLFVQNVAKETAEYQLVQKILGAAKLDENNYLIVDKTVHSNIALRHFDKLHFKNIHAVISFGLNSKSIGLNTIDNKYHLIQIEDYGILFADNVSDLQNDSRKKGLLWTNMKKMFKIE